jgi:hypothetical protein
VFSLPPFHMKEEEEEKEEVEAIPDLKSLQV